ncbi:MAG TPA: TolC family protein [Fluviicoccus sp.]|nr:TolC family protein [Fluviicoccus sp.]
MRDSCSHYPFRRRLLRLAVWLALVCQIAPLHADSVGQSLAQLWRNHPDIRRAEAAIKAAGYDRTAAYSGFWPYLQTDLVRSNRDGGSDYVVRAVMPLWQGGQTLASIDSAKAVQALAVADLQKARLQLGLRLTESYFSVVAYREQAELWRRYREVLEGLSGMIRRRADAGASPQSDVVSIISRIRQAEASLEMNQAGLSAAEAQFRALTGADGLPSGWPDTGSLLTAEEAGRALERALQAHPDLVYAQAAVSREQADTRIKRSGLSPEVALRYVRPVGGDSTAEPETQLTLQYQTDGGVKAYQGWQAGRQRVDAAQAAVESARRDISSAINMAHAQWRMSSVQMEQQAAAVEAADKVVESFLRQFEAGRKSWLEVLNAQREVHETRLQLVDQRRNLWQANAKLALAGLYWDRIVEKDVNQTGISPDGAGGLTP